MATHVSPEVRCDVSDPVHQATSSSRFATRSELLSPPMVAATIARDRATTTYRLQGTGRTTFHGDVQDARVGHGRFAADVM